MKKMTFISITTALTLLSNSAFAFTHSLNQGWNLLGATEDITNFENFKQNGSIMWVYDGDWQKIDLNSNSKIESGKGFWFKANAVGSVNTEVNQETNKETNSNNNSLNLILYAPIPETTTYLIDSDKNVVHTWESSYRPGLAVYLQSDGSIIRAGSTTNSTFGKVGGSGGVVQKISWDGNVEWEYVVSDTTYLQHHDLEILPNGNILLSVWERISEADALAKGREATNIDSTKGVWADEVREINPTTNEIVWQWRVWEHTTTNSSDKTKIDINYVGNGPDSKYDWNHMNSIDYNAELDQILLSAKNFNEIWIIDHNTTTAEASTSKGDLLYRFGNPATYGSTKSQVLYGEHDAEWIDSDTIMLFNNGMEKGNRNYSTVDVFDLPVNSGSYDIQKDATNVWSYSADDLFSSSISGVCFLGDGNYLITEGSDGRIFMVNENKEKLWEFEVGGSVFKAEVYKSDYLIVE